VVATGMGPLALASSGCRASRWLTARCHFSRTTGCLRSMRTAVDGRQETVDRRRETGDGRRETVDGRQALEIVPVYCVSSLASRLLSPAPCPLACALVSCIPSTVCRLPSLPSTAYCLLPLASCLLAHCPLPVVPSPWPPSACTALSGAGTRRKAPPPPPGIPADSVAWRRSAG